MKKLNMTMDEYDILCARINCNPYKCDDWWPSIDDLNKYVLKKPEEYIEFLIWITETANEPKTKEDNESKNKINNILIKILEIR